MFASLAPARRRLVFVLLALVLVAVVAAVAAFVASRPASDPVASVDQSVPGPVLLIPGFGGSTDSLDVLAAELREDGRDATVVALPDGGVGDLTVQAQTLRDAVDAALARTGATSVDVVGYSAGGVVARLWAADLGGAEQARRIVTLGSPHHGTQVAALAAQFVPDQCATACQQLAPDSSVFAALNSGDETPEGPQWVSIWTELDQVVTPPTSAELDGAVNIPVQSVCADSTVDHGNLPRDPLVGAMVSAQLDGDSTTQLGAADCSRLSS
ncbi:MULTISPECIES: esterase/lipase family protein [Rhodococcus]|uniref:Alpha/beta fold hydrolase n=1 Tax=Rhodococcus cerastii TaxID=908616 RepID=A0ABU4D2A1_9NOCA|nr:MULTISPECIES: alpha/beta fold hydrolase [Rhodococcus]MDV6303521.1 alpha/beta fold hydrolase [Rhodococcus cerastii]MDV7989194.1 alpha/beta fold hydrolase [Rhodococcus sp. IEGM 1374]